MQGETLKFTHRRIYERSITYWGW